MSKACQTYNERNGCFVLIAGGRVQGNQKRPFADIPFDCAETERIAAEISALSPDNENRQPETPPDNGNTDADLEEAPTADETDMHDNPYEWW